MIERMIEMPTGVVVTCVPHDLRDSLHTVQVKWDEEQGKPENCSSLTAMRPGDRIYLDTSLFVLRFRPKEGDRVSARVLGGSQLGIVKHLHTSNMKIDKVTLTLDGGPDVTVPIHCVRPLK